MTLCLTMAPAVAATPLPATAPTGSALEAVELLSARVLKVQQDISMNFTTPKAKTCQDRSLNLSGYAANLLKDGVRLNTTLKTTIKGDWVGGAGQITVTGRDGQPFTYHHVCRRAGCLHYIVPGNVTLAALDGQAVDWLFSCRAALSTFITQTYDFDAAARIASCADTKLRLMNDAGLGKTPVTARPKESVVRLRQSDGAVSMEIMVAVRTRSGSWLTSTEWVRGGLVVPAYISTQTQKP